MKLVDIREEIIAEDDNFEVVALQEVFGTRYGVRAKAGGVIRKGVKGIKANPGLAMAAGMLAVAGISTYNKNKRNTVRLFAKGPQERRLSHGHVNDILKTGHYRKKREKSVSGGYLWDLKRK